MPEIKLEHVTKRWAKFYAVEDLNLTIENNAFVTLLGPSGCGKTTTLRMIAGLETPTSGRITIGDKVVFDSDLGINVPANKRKVGFLFQNYALWPHMTVYKNIAFGLIQQKALLAGGKAAVAGQKLTLIVLGRGLVAKQIVDADPKIIRNAPQGVIVRLADSLCIVAQGGRAET